MALIARGDESGAAVGAGAVDPAVDTLAGGVEPVVKVAGGSVAIVGGGADWQLTSKVRLSIAANIDDRI